jgi:aspartate/methionine/tyrosine aminotransferase
MDLLDCQYDKNQSGMFVWAKIPSNYNNCYELADEILEKAGVFITPGGIFGTAGEQYVRTSLCAEVSVFEEAILRIRKGLGIC